MYKAIIFDFGNTLAASASLATALTDVLQHPQAMSIGQQIEQEILALYRPDQQQQPDWCALWQRCFEQAGVDFNESLGREHLRAFCQASPTFDGVESLLQTLKQRGIKLGLLSNATGPADVFQQDFERRGLAPYFDAITWSCAIGYRKPYGLAFEAALQQLGSSAAETLMVGDSEIADVGGAHAIGMDCARIYLGDGNDPSNARYKAHVDTLEQDILAIFAQQA